jgi:hypothetical protein
MEKYIQEGSNDKPIIILDPEQGSIFIGGSSLPENVLEVYNPILCWFDSYSQQSQPNTKIDFFFEYLNTASSHMVMRIFDKIKLLREACPNISVNWHYLKGDHDMYDFGNELEEMVDFPVKIIDSDHFQFDHYF